MGSKKLVHASGIGPGVTASPTPQQIKPHNGHIFYSWVDIGMDPEIPLDLFLQAKFFSKIKERIFVKTQLRCIGNKGPSNAVKLVLLREACELWVLEKGRDSQMSTRLAINWKTLESELEVLCISV